MTQNLERVQSKNSVGPICQADSKSFIELNQFSLKGIFVWIRKPSDFSYYI